MKAHVITQFGPPSVFQSVEVSKPSIQPGHLLIRVWATSVNPIDCKMRAGAAPQITPDFPAILHGDVSGIVEEVGEGVTDFSVGDAVFGCAGGVKGSGGALAEYMLVDARLMAIVPTTLTMAEAAALPLVCITAWEALIDKLDIQPGHKILIHAGTGGVGHVAIQLAQWRGAEVYTTVSSPQKAKLAQALGVVDTINYHEESVQDYVNRLTDGQGFDAVLDTVGGDLISQSLEAVAVYGDVATIQSRGVQLDLSVLQAKSASLHGVFMLLPLLRNVQRERHGKILKAIAS
jgi:NADPH2:quinone reductase